MTEEEEQSPLWSGDEPLRSEPRGFSHEQMVTCEACLRSNPPTRTACLYCGAALPVTDASASFIKPTLRPLEKWEQGFNTVLLSSEQQISNDSFWKIADLLKLDAEEVKRIFTSGETLPLARAATEEEALVIEKQLEAMGIRVLVVTDAELDAHAPKRLRAMELKDDALIVYPAGVQGGQKVLWKDVLLFVAGRRIIRKLEVSERQVKKQEKEIVESRELSADEPRLDFYAARDESGWRVTVDNFDFSCLGNLKTLVAAKNFQTLTAMLRERATNAVYDDSYLRVRNMLTLVWPLEQHTESLGLRKQRMGRVHIEAVTTSDNETQFTRYSRLLHYLKLRQIDLKR